MRVTALGTYRPAWDAGGGGRVCGLDEDVATLAVEAGRHALAGHRAAPERIVLVTGQPDFLESSTGAVISSSLGAPLRVNVEEQLGGGTAALAALASATEGTLVVAVSPGPPAGAAAALVGKSGAGVALASGYSHSVPVRIRHAGAAAARIYDDPRLLRERAWRPAIAAVAGGETVVALSGVHRSDLQRLGVEPLDVPPVGGAAEPLFALSALLARGHGGRLVAVDGGSALAVDVEAGDVVLRRGEHLAGAGVPPSETIEGEIPLSMPAYERAFDAKVGFRGARCKCGAVTYPPRTICVECGRADGWTPEQLPRTGTVYTTTTIHIAVPGLAAPYSLVIVALDGIALRVLAHVTSAPAGSVRIGDRGELVLRRVAIREGVPDYGYGFAPDSEDSP